MAFQSRCLHWGGGVHTAGTIIHQYHYSEALSSKLNWLACLKLDLTIILISQPRGELIC